MLHPPGQTHKQTGNCVLLYRIIIIVIDPYLSIIIIIIITIKITQIIIL